MACGARLLLARLDGHPRRRCPRCGWVFYDNPVPAVVALIERRGAVLLARRAADPYRGTWDLPGGFMESGETPEAALARELREELGVRLRGRPRLAGHFADTYGQGGFPVLGIVYRVGVRGRLRAADDVGEVRWVPRARLPLREIRFPGLRAALRALVGPRAAPGRARRGRAARRGRPARASRGARPRGGRRR
jgi:ADP-ribose pyrophosphatase YjhB (NUDIX family)